MPDIFGYDYPKYGLPRNPKPDPISPEQAQEIRKIQARRAAGMSITDDSRDAELMGGPAAPAPGGPPPGASTATQAGAKPPPPQPPPGTAAAEVPTPPTPGGPGLAPSPASTINSFAAGGHPLPEQIAKLDPSVLPQLQGFTQRIINGPNETLTQFARMPEPFMDKYRAGNSQFQAVGGGEPIEASMDPSGKYGYRTLAEAEAAKHGGPGGMPTPDESMRTMRQILTPHGIPVPGIEEKMAGAYSQHMDRLAQIQAAQTTAGANRMQNMVLAAKKIYQDEYQKGIDAQLSHDESHRRALDAQKNFVAGDVELMKELGIKTPAKGEKDEKDKTDKDIAPLGTITGAGPAAKGGIDALTQYYTGNRERLLKDPTGLQSFLNQAYGPAGGKPALQAKLARELIPIMQRQNYTKLGPYSLVPGTFGAGLTGPELSVPPPGFEGMFTGTMQPEKTLGRWLTTSQGTEEEYNRARALVEMLAGTSGLPVRSNPIQQ